MTITPHQASREAVPGSLCHLPVLLLSSPQPWFLSPLSVLQRSGEDRRELE